MGGKKATKAARMVRVSVPASSGNLGSGFDVLAAALDIRLELEVSEGPPGLLIAGEGQDSLPLDRKNLVLKILAKHLPGRKLAVRMTNAIPLGRGLGSSGAARLAAYAAGLALNGKDPAGALALAAADEGHPDNVVASYYGGITAVLDAATLSVQRFPAPKGLSAVVCVPAFELSTRLAREALPDEVPLEDAVFNLSRMAAWLSALHTGDWSRLRLATQDALHQPYRRSLVPGMRETIEAALAAGAQGACLSGAGPSVVAFCAKGADAEAVARSMTAAFRSMHVTAASRLVAFDRKGLEVSR